MIQDLGNTNQNKNAPLMKIVFLALVIYLKKRKSRHRLALPVLAATLPQHALQKLRHLEKNIIAIQQRKV